jgi:hypothetical protein
MAWASAISLVRMGPLPECLDNSKMARTAYWHFWDSVILHP